MDVKQMIAGLFFVLGVIFIFFGITDFPFEKMIPIAGDLGTAGQFIAAAVCIVAGGVVLALYFKAEHDMMVARQTPVTVNDMGNESRYYGPEGNPDDDGYDRSSVISAFAGGRERAADDSERGRVQLEGALQPSYMNRMKTEEQSKGAAAQSSYNSGNPMLGGNVVKPDIIDNVAAGNGGANMDPSLGAFDPTAAHSNIQGGVSMFGDTPVAVRQVTGNGLRSDADIPGGGFVEPILGGGNPPSGNN